MSADEFFTGFKNGLVDSMNTCAIGRIERFDPTIMQADVTILPDNDLILNVPVHTPQSGDFIIRIPYKVGDIGFVVFAQAEIDDVMYGGVGGEKSSRKKAIDDAIFVGGINLFNGKMPTGHESDLVITKKDFTSKIVLTESGDIILNPSGKFIVDAPGGVDINGSSISLTGGAITANGEDLTTDLT